LYAFIFLQILVIVTLLKWAQFDRNVLDSNVVSIRRSSIKRDFDNISNFQRRNPASEKNYSDIHIDLSLMQLCYIGMRGSLVG
jgi:hypothetical protein